MIARFGRTFRNVVLVGAIALGGAASTEANAAEAGTWWSGGCLVTYYYDYADPVWGTTKSGQRVSGYRRYDMKSYVHFCMPV